MLALKRLAGSLGVILSGYLLLNANGVYGAMSDRALGWNITPLPSHPVVAIVSYLAVGFGLQLISAWLLMSTTTDRLSGRFWTRCAATLGLCIGGSLIAAILIAFVIMALLDAGVI